MNLPHKFANFIRRPLVGQLLPVLGFAAWYGMVLIQGLKGFGNFWDWSFPYYSNELSVAWTNQIHSWTEANYGTPLSYNSDYFYRFVMAQLAKLPIQPEHLLYGMLVLSFTVGSVAFYRLARRRMKPLLAVLTAAMVYSNPAILYKVVAGHTYYLYAFTIFILIIYYLVASYRPTWTRTAILGILVAIVGIQIQFFTFAALLLIVALWFKRKEWGWHFSYFLLILIPLCINLPWLVNFVTGGANLSAIAGIAKSQIFATLSSGSMLSILNLTYSDATSIESMVASRWYFVFFLALHSFFFYELAVSRKNRITAWAGAWLILMLVLMFMSLGLVQILPILPFTILAPMFREIGHFGPVIILFELLVIQEIYTYRVWPARLFVAYSLIFVVIAGANTYRFAPRVNFSTARAHYDEFENSSLAPGPYRVLTYPFFGQYAFNWVKDRYSAGGRRLNNTGWEIYTKFSGYDSIDNNMESIKFADSVQTSLLNGGDINLLRQRNIEYIFDYQTFEESMIEQFVSPDSYDNNISIVKNRPNFLATLKDRYPDDFEFITPHILHLKTVMPRVEGGGATFHKINPTTYEVQVHTTHDPFVLSLLSNYHPQWKVLVGNVKDPASFAGLRQIRALPELPQGNHKMVYDYANQWTVNPGIITSAFPASAYVKNPDGSISLNLIIFFAPEYYMYFARIISVATMGIFSVWLLIAALRYCLIRRRV